MILFVYVFDDGVFQVDVSFQGLEVGSYDFMVEDVNGCQVLEVVSVGVLLSLVVNFQDVILFCDSSFIVLKLEILSGDDGFLQFSWSDGIIMLEWFVGVFGILEL